MSSSEEEKCVGASSKPTKYGPTAREEAEAFYASFGDPNQCKEINLLLSEDAEPVSKQIIKSLAPTQAEIDEANEKIICVLDAEWQQHDEAFDSFDDADDHVLDGDKQLPYKKLYDVRMARQQQQQGNDDVIIDDDLVASLKIRLIEDDENIDAPRAPARGVPVFYSEDRHFIIQKPKDVVDDDDYCLTTNDVRLILESPTQWDEPRLPFAEIDEIDEEFLPKKRKKLGHLDRRTREGKKFWAEMQQTDAYCHTRADL